MKVLGRFQKEDGSVTPCMTLEEINSGKAQEYGITEEHIKKIFFRSNKYLIESLYPGFKLSLQ